MRGTVGFLMAFGVGATLAVALSGGTAAGYAPCSSHHQGSGCVDNGTVDKVVCPSGLTNRIGPTTAEVSHVIDTGLGTTWSNGSLIGRRKQVHQGATINLGCPGGLATNAWDLGEWGWYTRSGVVVV